MPKGLSSRDIIKVLAAAGWVMVAQRGSHRQYKHPSALGRVTVPHPVRDLPPGTLRSIERQSGLKLK